MTITSNIVMGVANWTSSTSYPTVGALAANGGNCYQVVVPGTSASSGGPTGTGPTITYPTWLSGTAVGPVTVSGQTLSVSAATSGNVRVNMATPTVAGNWYVEITTPTVSVFEAFGIVEPSWLAGDPNSTPGDLADGVGILGDQSSGNSIVFNNTASGNSVPLTSGGTVGIAYNASLNAVFFGVNGNFGTTSTGANPVTGVGGFVMTGMTPPYTVGFGDFGGHSADSVVLNSGQSAFSFQPSGYPSPAPPAGSPAIIDGTVTWAYICHIDYTDPISWVSGIPGSVTQPIVGQLLSAAPINITNPSGAAYLTFSGHSTSPTNTITMKAFPGFGIGDVLAPLTHPLTAYATSGAGFLITSADTGYPSYFLVSDANVIFDGLQFVAQGISITIHTTIGATGFILRNSIINAPGGSVTTGSGAVSAYDQCAVIGNVFIDPAVVTFTLFLEFNANNSFVVNNTFCATGGAGTGSIAVHYYTTTGAVVRNNAVFGYGEMSNGFSGGSATGDHNVTDSFRLSSDGTMVDGGGNQLAVASFGQFVGFPVAKVGGNGSGDLRLPPGSNIVGAGVVDLTNIPSGLDIAGHTRIAPWSAGAWQYGLVAIGVFY